MPKGARLEDGRERGAFPHRGVVEGFYGTPWSHADRLSVIERIGTWGMNLYVYAPKEDRLHRADWREPYPEETLREFSELCERGAHAGVDVGFAVSPGLSISYVSADDRRDLAKKLLSFAKLGARFFALALDDVPTRLVHQADREAFDSLADAHVALANDVREALGPDAKLWLVPTDYLGVEPTAYLETLGTELDPSIEIGWTGRTVLSPTVEAREAQARAETLRRPVLVWDNTPVADGPMRSMLHLGPYAGRAPGLAAHISGVLLNPMQHAHASLVQLHTAARWLRDPERYDPETAWREAVREVGAGAPDAMRLFAEAHRFSALAADDRDRELEAGLAELTAATRGDASPAALVAELRAKVGARADAGAALRDGLEDRALARDLEPWITSHARETAHIAAALELIEAVLSGASGIDTLQAFSRLEGRFSREPRGPHNSYGPRRVLYPQLASMDDEAMHFGRDPCLFVDRCLVDDFVALAEELALRRLGPGG